MDLINTFHNRATSTWLRLLTARQLDLHYGEEGLTDENLLWIRKKHSREVRTITFSKKRESHTGADWEWWFMGVSGFIGFRVQAKVIDPKTVAYEHLHYLMKKKTRHQSDVLIDDAIDAGFPYRIPVYCLYSNWDTSQFSYKWDCQKFNRSVRSYGCAIVPATVVKGMRYMQGKRVNGNRIRGNELAIILPYMRPWHCMLCDCRESTRKRDLPQRAFAFWKNVIRHDERRLHSELAPSQRAEVFGEDNSLLRRYNELEVTTDPPRYVLELFETGRVNQNTYVQLEASGLRSITIFSETGVE